MGASSTCTSAADICTCVAEGEALMRQEARQALQPLRMAVFFCLLSRPTVQLWRSLFSVSVLFSAFSEVHLFACTCSRITGAFV